MKKELLEEQDLSQITGGGILGNAIGSGVYWITRGALSKNKLLAKQHHIKVGY